MFIDLLFLFDVSMVVEVLFVYLFSVVLLIVLLFDDLGFL